MKNFVRKNIGLAIALLCILSACKQKEEKKDVCKIYSAVIQQDSIREIPDGKRVAFGWQATGMLPGDTVFLSFDNALKGQYCWLRVTVAQEIWNKNIIKAFIPGTQTELGAFDIKYSSVLVPYEIEIPCQHLSQIEQKGIALTLESKAPFWFYAKTSSASIGLTPHLLLSDAPVGDIDDFLNCFLSDNSIQAFGWREGTVLDGLWQLYSKIKDEKALEAINSHLRFFFDDRNNLIFENAGSKPNDNKVDGIESTIPFATLVRFRPNHPILDTVLCGWQHLKKENGMIIDGTMVSAEGCYTISYPMALIGKARNDKALIQEAQEQLKHRFVLINDGDFYLRYYTEGKYTYRNWARGAAWFLLGYVRTIEELGVENVDKEIIEKYKEAVDIALSMQRESDALWSCFMDDENSLPDASGSAGITAAVMTGINLKILPEEYTGNVERCYASLQNYITPDGFLKGVAQDNRGGESLQRSDYRVIAQMGMGMMAQLYAAIYQNKQEK